MTANLTDAFAGRRLRDAQARILQEADRAVFAERATAKALDLLDGADNTHLVRELRRILHRPRCDAYAITIRCALTPGHAGDHTTPTGSTWPHQDTA